MSAKAYRQRLDTESFIRKLKIEMLQDGCVRRSNGTLCLCRILFQYPPPAFLPGIQITVQIQSSFPFTKINHSGPEISGISNEVKRRDEPMNADRRFWTISTTQTDELACNASSKWKKSIANLPGRIPAVSIQ
jgi:hypothetical protein